jgi:hypothetical protein
MSFMHITAKKNVGPFAAEVYKNSIKEPKLVFDGFWMKKM